MDFLGLAGKSVLVLGVANRKSVAFHVGRTLTEVGARVVYVVRSEERRESVAKLLADAEILVCDVEFEEQIERLRVQLAARNEKLAGLLHSIALADYDDGMKPFHETPKRAFLRAMDISCHSLIALSNALKDLLEPDASVVTVSIVARVRPGLMPQVPSMPIAERLRAARGLWKLVLLFFLAVVGIYLGWFSPTEAAGIAAFAAIVIAFATRTMGWRGLLDALVETVNTTAMLFFIVVGAFIFARFIVLTQFPAELARWVQEWGLSPAMIMIAVMLLYFLLGTFLEEVSTILITVPVVLPLVTGLGYDGVWFGIFVTVMATIGLVSPPTGLTVFVIQAQNPDIPVAQIYRGTLPFLVADFVLVALLIAAPGIVAWLPAVLKM